MQRISNISFWFGKVGLIQNLIFFYMAVKEHTSCHSKSRVQIKKLYPTQKWLCFALRKYNIIGFNNLKNANFLSLRMTLKFETIEYGTDLCHIAHARSIIVLNVKCPVSSDCTSKSRRKLEKECKCFTCFHLKQPNIQLLALDSRCMHFFFY